MAPEAEAGRMSSATPEYWSWASMRGRCLNPKNPAYRNYGGRGITICDRWQRFEHFLADMGPRPSRAHSIDRIDNNGSYEPGNCRWATADVQSNNRRSNRRITINGETKGVSQWARHLGIGASTANMRLRRKGSLDLAERAGRGTPKSGASLIELIAKLRTKPYVTQQIMAIYCGVSEQTIASCLNEIEVGHAK